LKNSALKVDGGGYDRKGPGPFFTDRPGVRKRLKSESGGLPNGPHAWTVVPPLSGRRGRTVLLP